MEEIFQPSKRRANRNITTVRLPAEWRAPIPIVEQWESVDSKKSSLFRPRIDWGSKHGSRSRIFQTCAIDFVSAETRTSHLVTRLAGPEIPRVTVSVSLSQRRIIGRYGRGDRSNEWNDRNTEGRIRWRRKRKKGTGIKKKKRSPRELREYNVRQSDNEVSL